MYHIADAVNMEAIGRDGLLSTNALLHRGGYGQRVEEQVRAHRAASITLPDGRHVRDQRPMSPASLDACLDPGMLPDDWYHLTNAHVFFWLDRERVLRHLQALRGRPQVVLALDARGLASTHAEAAYVTPFNIGNARRLPASRGLRTLVPLQRWREHGWKSEALPGQRSRSSSHPPVELLVRDAVRDHARYIIGVEQIAGQ